MFVKVITRPSPEICGGLCLNALVLPDSSGAVAGSDCREEKPPALSGVFGAEQACWGVVVGSLDKEFKMCLKIAISLQNEFANSIPL